MKRAKAVFGVALGLAVACGRPASAPDATTQPRAPTPAKQRSALVGPDRSRLPEPGPVPVWRAPEPTRLQLENGLSVLCHVQTETPLATLMLVIPRGSATDPAGKSGLTALTVDLLDEGAGGKGALELDAQLQTMATDFFARTDVDHIVVGMNLLSEQLEASVQALADIVRRPMLLPEEFARRKAQQISKLLAAEANPDYAREVVLLRALFGDGYGGARPYGTAGTLEQVAFADVRRQYRALFAPNDAAFVFVGNATLSRVRSVLQSTFGDWGGSAGTQPVELRAEPPNPGVYLVDFPGASQSAIAVARRAKGQSAEDYFAAMVFSRAFGGAFTSRLNMNLRESKGYTYGASSWFERWSSAGVFRISANVKTEVTRKSLDEVFRELREVSSRRPISDKEHREAIDGLLLGYPGRFERMAGVAAQFTTIPLYRRGLDWFSRWTSHVEAQTPGAVNDFAKRSGQLDDYVVVVAGDRQRIESTLRGLHHEIHQYDARGEPVRP